MTRRKVNFGSNLAFRCRWYQSSFQHGWATCLRFCLTDLNCAESWLMAWSHQRWINKAYIHMAHRQAYHCDNGIEIGSSLFNIMMTIAAWSDAVIPSRRHRLQILIRQAGCRSILDGDVANVAKYVAKTSAQSVCWFETCKVEDTLSISWDRSAWLFIRFGPSKR